LFAFGHGLGYTEWQFDSLSAPADAVRAGDDVDVTVALRNMGTRDGREVVQVYLEAPGDDPRRPVRTLAGFARVSAEPGETVEADAAPPSTPDFGPNVHIFKPSTDQAAIQAELNAIAVAQVHNEFGTRRDAVLFAPGTYGSAAHPLVFQVGYYTSVAGLGISPDDVHINGAIEVPNQCNTDGCFALTNFWRSLSNLTIDVHTSGAPALPATAPEDPGCVSSNDLYAVSQAAPIRRVAVNGSFFLFDSCGPKGFGCGGFIADSQLGVVINATPQQWMTRNSSISVWPYAVWNQAFSRVSGAPHRT